MLAIKKKEKINKIKRSGARSSVRVSFVILSKPHSLVDEKLWRTIGSPYPRPDTDHCRRVETNRGITDSTVLTGARAHCAEIIFAVLCEITPFEGGEARGAPLPRLESRRGEMTFNLAFSLAGAFFSSCKNKLDRRAATPLREIF